MIHQIALTIPGLTDLQGHGGRCPEGIEILSWNLHVKQSTPAASMLRKVLPATPYHDDLDVTRYADELSPLLNYHCSNGTVFSRATLRIREARALLGRWLDDAGAV